MTMDGIRVLVFDMGGVLIHYRWKEMLCDYGLPMEEAVRVGQEIFNNPRNIWHEYDMATMSTDEVIAAYEEMFPEDAEVITWFIRHGEYMHVPRPKVWALVHRLKEAGWPMYLLSNYPEELFHKHTEYADVMQDLDGMVVSYTDHLSKPEPAIYESLLNKYNLTASECIFFDDRKENVEGARRCGMHGRQVLSQEGLIEDLTCILNGQPLADRAAAERTDRLPEK